MQKRLLTVLMCMIAVSLSSFAAPKKPTPRKASSAGPVPDQAYIQKIWDGWATIDPANVAPYYAKGPNTFFDIAPVKYTSWEDYAEGVKKEFAGYKSFALGKGFLLASASPLTRSSYHAGEDFARLRAARIAKLAAAG